MAKKKGCYEKKTRKGVTYYLSAVCPAGKQLASEVAREVKNHPDVKKAIEQTRG